MSNLLILGAGGHSRVVYELASATGSFSNIAFLDDKSRFLKPPNSSVIGPLERCIEPIISESYTSAIVAIGNPHKRLKWTRTLISIGYIVPTLVHPFSSVSPSATLGMGSVVFAGAVVQADTTIGLAAIINTSSSVDHGSRLGNGVHVCPGAHLAGDVGVGSRSTIGIGATVIQGIEIESDVTVGAGAVVVNNIPAGLTVVGVPAHPHTPSHR